MNKSDKRQQEFESHCLNKTIVKVDARAVNCVVFYFSDGTKLDLETEYAGHGLYAISICQ